MVRNVRLGLPPLAADGVTDWEFEDRMRDTSYPERDGSDEDRALAAVLSTTAEHSRQEMPLLLRRVGLAGLHAELDLPANVTMLSSRRRNR